MIRFLTLLAVVAAIGAAAGLYNVKLRTAELADAVQRLETEIAREDEVISVLKAEWSLLTQPDRLQRLAERHLSLTPLRAEQIVRIEVLSDNLALLREPEAEDLSADGESAGDTAAPARTEPDAGAPCVFGVEVECR